MYKQIITIILITLPLFSGCILQDQQSVTIDKYNLNHELEEISVTLPRKAQLPTNVSLEIHFPKDKIKGTYNKRTYDYNVNFQLPDIKLYQTGIYTAKYETKNTIYYDYFFVGNTDPRLSFDIVNFTANNNEVYLKVANNGKIDGFLHVILYSTKPVQQTNKLVYNKELFNDHEYIKNGHFMEYTNSVPSNELGVLINGEIYESE